MLVQEMTRQECHAFLKRIAFGRLGCARQGQPYVVPIYFVSDEEHLYCFSTFGQKIEWMRENPLVCVEADEVVNQLHWKSVVVLGKYEELSDGPHYRGLREYAFELLQKRAMWWQPAYVAAPPKGLTGTAQPLFYRIHINEITGHKAIPDSFEELGSKVAGQVRPNAGRPSAG
jgi:nitroimidazol reductase NimA-like FMN-containing flavoprotein (pyridoxamine 5'-phosphate oxidase superfamily)